MKHTSHAFLGAANSNQLANSNRWCSAEMRGNSMVLGLLLLSSNFPNSMQSCRGLLRIILHNMHSSSKIQVDRAGHIYEIEMQQDTIFISLKMDSIESRSPLRQRLITLGCTLAISTTILKPLGVWREFFPFRIEVFTKLLSHTIFLDCSLTSNNGLQE